MIFRTGSVLIVGKCDDSIFCMIFIILLKKSYKMSIYEIVTNNINTETLVKKKETS